MESLCAQMLRDKSHDILSVEVFRGDDELNDRITEKNRRSEITSFDSKGYAPLTKVINQNAARK